MAETLNQSDFNAKKPTGEEARNERVKESDPVSDPGLKRMFKAAERIPLCDPRRFMFY